MRKLAMLLMLSVAHLYSQSPPRNRADQKSESDKGHKTPTDIPQSATSPVNNFQSAPEQKTTTDRPQQVWKKAIAPETWPNWCLVIAAIVGSIFAVRTLGALNRQVSANEIAAVAALKGAEAAQTSAKALINSERAWMKVTDILAPEGGLPNGFIFNLINVGKTPAKLARLMLRCHSLAGSDELAEFPDYTDGLRHVFRDEPGYETLLIPGEKLSSPLRMAFPDLINLNDIRNGASQLYAYGLLSYVDSFGKGRTLQFGYTYSPGQKIALDWTIRPQWASIPLKEYNRDSEYEP